MLDLECMSYACVVHMDEIGFCYVWNFELLYGFKKDKIYISNK